MDTFETEVLDVIREALMLPETMPSGFSATSNLFETFGLDSVDALEIVMALKRTYGIVFSQEDERNKQIFTSIRTIAGYVAEHRKPAEA